MIRKEGEQFSEASQYTVGQGVGKDTQETVRLIDGLNLIGRKKWTLVLMTLVPTVVAMVFLLYMDRNISMVYLYNAPLRQKNFEIFRYLFYSRENIEKVVKHLNHIGAVAYAERLEGATSSDDLRKWINFNLKVFSGTDSSSLLEMKLVMKSTDPAGGIADVIRENVEQVLPMYTVVESLQRNIDDYQKRLSEIEQERSDLEFRIKEGTAVLKALKEMKPTESAAEIILQFNQIHEDSQYLPLASQIQAYEIKMVDLEKRKENNEAQHD